MRARDQLIGAVALAIATYYGVVKIAEAKCDAAVGSRGVLLDEKQPEDLAALMRLEARLDAMGQGSLVERLEDLRRKRQLWVGPGMGPERWAAYVEALGLVRRIYVRRVALRSPLTHLYPSGNANVPEDYQDAFAWLSLAGAMRHELAHLDGAHAEAEAYGQEIAWYAEIQRSAFLSGLEGKERAAWDWAIESAFMSARKAARQAGAN